MSTEVNLDMRAQLAKTSEAEMEALLQDFEPYLNVQAAKFAAPAGSANKDEFFSAAMEGFYQAIRSFCPQKGHFFPYAARAVRYNMIDQLRKLYTISTHTATVDDEQSRQIDIGHATAQYALSKEREAVRFEIEELKAELAAWNISMNALYKSCPKHKRLVQEYKRIAKLAANHIEIVQTIQIKRYLPMSKISEVSGMPVKKLEYARTYLLTLIIINLGNYEYLKEYVS